jgi:hypothetical protein
VASTDHGLGARADQDARVERLAHLGGHLLGLGGVLRRHEHERQIRRRAAELCPHGTRRLGGARARVGGESGRDLDGAADGGHSMILQSVVTSAVVDAEMKQSRSAFGVSSRAAAACPPAIRTYTTIDTVWKA